MPASVRIWNEQVVIPTYLVGEPNRNPMFLEKRVYQGSSGRVYPYPVIDRICDEKVEETHPVVFLENEYLKLMVMPGFGGRIQYAYDKTNKYPFIYHNRVIKPALVGLAGPWLSGGIEFNWPQHHRPGTYCPVDHTITRDADGSMTLWLSEIEPMWHLKGTLGMTLYPGKAFLEINIRLFNPTPLPQSFHLWTNPAVHVNDQYQSVFPPDVQAVYDHGKRDVSSFPIARGEYYKVDYSRGVDISWYKNLPVPTSYMAAKSDYDFVGGYDHGKKAGVLHVADHQVVPGKKQWVWGCGDFGKAWDRNLTDEDGPYAELMCGVFADNQPDFSWLQPFEEKEVRQYFLPYKAIGYVRNATIDAALSLEISNGKALLGAYTTSACPKTNIRVAHQQKIVWESTRDLAPDRPVVTEVKLPKGIRAEDLELSVCSKDGQRLVAYRPEPKQAAAIPQPARPIPRPAQIRSNEALFLAGLHLEQYRHATREAEDYYREALRRDPDDIRNNNALGLLLLRRGQFSKAEPLFRSAIRTQIRHNPNPQDGEPYYNLGVCLRYLARPMEAYAAFFKATWNAAWQDGAFFQLAQLVAAQAHLSRIPLRQRVRTRQWAKNSLALNHASLTRALQFVESSLSRNAHNQKATHLKTMLLRKLGREVEARQIAESALARDPLDFGARNELEIHGKCQAGDRGKWLSCATYLEIAADYAHAGAYEEAINLLEKAAELRSTKAPKSGSDVQARRAPGHVGDVGMPNVRPMVFYFLGYYASQLGDSRAASKYFRLAEAQNPDRCFPNSLDSILALQAALSFNPRDAHASFYLGNLWYDKRQVTEATGCWEAARRANPSLSTVHRNLALVYFNKQHDDAKALRALQQAFALDPTDARVLFELDLLKKRVGDLPPARLAFLRKHFAVVQQREDLFLEFVTLLNFSGKNHEALEALLGRKFHPWEGGEGKVTAQYVASLVEMAKGFLERKPQANRCGVSGEPRARRALEFLERAQHYPANLAEGKLHGAQENAIHFCLGVALDLLGDHQAAREAWQKASKGMKIPTPAVYYNDQNPETIFYQGLSLKKLGRISVARERFKTLVRFGKAHLKDHVVIDYFAVSLPEFMVFDDNMDLRNQINCRYLMALGYFGLGQVAVARHQLRKVLSLDPSHLGAQLHLKMFSSRS
jgi:tetratricopeptide (TPR) repeat protein